MSSSSRPMQHIDRKELYTNLEARVRYLHSFLDFSSKDIESLIYAGKYIKALIPAVVNILYKKLLQYDITARAFQTRSTSYEGPMDASLTEDSPQIHHRKLFLRAYLVKLCSDPRELEFWEYLDKVGMMHVGLGRTHPLHVEYVHIGAALGVIQDVLTEAILSHPKMRLERKISVVKALGKVIWIQNDLFAKWYVTDGEEFTDGVDYSGIIEKEGWLHGKKVLREDGGGDESKKDGDRDREEEGEKDGGETTPKRRQSDAGAGAGAAPTTPTRTEGVCPFSGMSAAAAISELKVSE